MLCDFGCGQEAKHQFINGKWCCSKHFSKCPKIKKTRSGKNNPMYNRTPWNKGKSGIYSNETLKKMRCTKSTKGKTYEEIYGEKKGNELRKVRSKHFTKIKTGSVPWNKGETGIYSKNTIEKIRKSHLLTKEEYKYRHPLFFEIETPEFIGTTIFVRCKYCNIKFIPNRIQLTERLRSLKTGKSNGYFYCSNECKNKCKYFGRQINPEQSSMFKEYIFKVYKETRKTLKKYKIKHIELRGIKNQYELDHKYSIYNGFINKVTPKLIAHHKNLQVIPTYQNRSKGSSSSITLKELLSFQI